MDPIFEIPTRGQVVELRAGEAVYPVRQLADGTNVIEAPEVFGLAHGYVRRLDLEVARRQAAAAPVTSASEPANDPTPEQEHDHAPADPTPDQEPKKRKRDAR